jgi:hypothetical protein
MPICCDPNETFTIVLKSDQNKPVEQQPRFIFHYLTGRQWKECDRINEDAGKCKTNAEGYDMVISGVKLGLKGWENLTNRDGEAIQYDPANLDLVLTISEAWELLFGLLGNTRLQQEDKKKLDSQSDLHTESSAANAKA